MRLTGFTVETLNLLCLFECQLFHCDNYISVTDFTLSKSTKSPLMRCIIFHRFFRSLYVNMNVDLNYFMSTIQQQSQSIYSSINGTEVQNANACCSTQYLVAVAAL